MTHTPVDTQLLQELRGRIAAVEGAGHLPVPTHPCVAGLVQLRAGASYEVDSASLAMAMLAGASASGEWTAAIGWPDLGVEAAAAYGADVTRTVLVPDPGEHWLEVTAALIDVMRLVLLRPSGQVPASTASTLAARLRKRSSALIVWGEWPRREARLTLEQVRWFGPQHGAGRLTHRRARVAVRRAVAPPAHGEWFIGEPRPDADEHDHMPGGEGDGQLLTPIVRRPA